MEEKKKKQMFDPFHPATRASGMIGEVTSRVARWRGTGGTG